MRVVIFSLLFCLLFAPFAFAQEFNAGFVQGLWYSQEKIFVGDSVRIYVAIRNNTGSDLTSTIEFFDNDTRLGSKSVQALNGRIIESWMDWKPAYGEHNLKATITRIELNKIGSNTEEVEVVSPLAEDTIFVDYDTDKDDIGNETDEDDDNDGITDEEEEEQGTDPLVADVSAEEEDNETEETVNTNSDDNANDGQGSAQQNTAHTSSNGSQGLERFFTAGPAENALSSVTNYIEIAKENLDEYREARNSRAASEKENNTASSSTGFGEVTRSSEAENDTVWTHDFSLWDFVKSVWGLALVIFNSVYTFVLASLSWVLGYPILVQVGLLLLILFLLIKLASKFGRRPKVKKL